jgi:hypothetical protein
LVAPRPQATPRFEPAYAEIGGIGVPPSTTRLQFEIEPLTMGAKYWAFVSVTNNDTQPIALFTPQ